MEKIHIKHVGPLSDTGEIELNRVMLLIGPQGAGKSTFMKILCFCRWVEKRIMQDDNELKQYANYKRFIKVLKKFYHLSDDFFSSKSEIIYQGECISITWIGGLSKNAKITKLPEFKTKRYNSKLSFIPAERNLVSAVENIDKAYRGKPGEDLLFNFLLELDDASKSYKYPNKLQLSIGQDYSYYRGEFGQHFIEQHSIKKSFLSYYTASGLQSVFPIDVLSSQASDSLGKTPSISIGEAAILVEWEKVHKNIRASDVDVVSLLNKRFEELRYKSIHLFIEEPELNLYPDSQKELLLNLLGIITKAKDKEEYPSSLVMTTHSPYLLSVINAKMAKIWAEEQKKGITKDKEEDEEDKEKKRNSNLSSLEFSAYYISKEGTLKDLIARDKGEDGNQIEFPMIDGTDLDSVSTWVNKELNDAYTKYYDED